MDEDMVRAALARATAEQWELARELWDRQADETGPKSNVEGLVLAIMIVEAATLEEAEIVLGRRA